LIGHPTPLADWLVIAPVILGLLGAAVLLVLRSAVRIQGWVCLGVVFAMFACDLLLIQRVLATGPVSMTMGKWLPPFGISFTADTMGAGFALTAAFVGFAVVLYLLLDAPESAERDSLYPLVLLLLAGVSGAFLTGDLFNLYVWFEVMLAASFGLVVLAGNPLQLDAAVKYGVLNFLATALFLLALGLFYGLVGTLNMADVISIGPSVSVAPLTAIAALFALAFGMKAAIFPVNAWLPASYHAPPAAISALLGALLTKVGVYAFIRLIAMLMPSAVRENLGPAITGFAVATVILGPLSALAETNLRRAIGFMLIGGVGVAILSAPAMQAATLAGGITYVIHAMLTLGALYLVAGLIEQTTGETDTRNMGGLYAQRSWLSILFLTLIFAISGVPPFLGFWPKLQLLQGFITGGEWLQVFSLLLGSLLTLAAGARLWSHIFWRPGPGAKHPTYGTAAASLIALTVALLGLMPGPVLEVGATAAAGMLNPTSYLLAVGLSP
jgi:multicomponent Na+:H+ antiporter subunit D